MEFPLSLSYPGDIIAIAVLIGVSIPAAILLIEVEVEAVVTRSYSCWCIMLRTALALALALVLVLVLVLVSGQVRVRVELGALGRLDTEDRRPGDHGGVICGAAVSHGYGRGHGHGTQCELGKNDEKNLKARNWVLRATVKDGRDNGSRNESFARFETGRRCWEGTGKDCDAEY